ncbi:Serine/threonine protein kinase of the CDC7 subfamily [Pseudoloma neurophilia]|uniref:non-specific serine/threonine protein kinase n=1 Tax=Pseudoloma neurophilia TaxID=146866 RepID=A0A0R0M8J4_9MICR|nr:Serine/threonine protein kinase of the CDC7 subfamily [Pseudoloma neurophilia]
MEEFSNEERSYFDWFSDKYKVIARAGEGTFSTVYKAVDLNRIDADNSYCNTAIKNITMTSSPMRVIEELKFLKLLNGEKNVIPLINVMRFEDQIVAVFPFFASTDFREYLEMCTLSDIRSYLRELLIAVEHTHKNNIIHRDIKPSNFLYNKDEKTGYLIDFGLAQKLKQEKVDVKETNKVKKTPTVTFFNSVVSKSTQPPGYYQTDTRPHMKAHRAGTRGFRAPEILFRNSNQSTSIDMWSVGVIFLILLTKQYPFFNSLDDNDALVEIACLFGNNEMRKIAKYHNRIWKTNIESIPNNKIPFKSLIKRLNPTFKIDDSAISLLDKMLELYPEKRITATEALEHPFFQNPQ